MDVEYVILELTGLLPRHQILDLALTEFCLSGLPRERGYWCWLDWGQLQLRAPKIFWPFPIRSARSESGLRRLMECWRFRGTNRAGLWLVAEPGEQFFSTFQISIGGDPAGVSTP